ncbi:MAG: PhzF family phenazine biosynthesis protein [Gemmatimonadetes bacterium]|nr:PhzF family phenazine biosynthesis protein [Gemmatimonadota bacterium]MBI3504348.1 PhzF family phenazine biosynthesis protein [Pseudomonadota bacterium]
MPEYKYLTLDVFTSAVFGGNQLAVFPDARGIPEEQLIAITREFNYSETTFCYPPADAAHAARVRIFTPGAEVPFAGHPTVGTAIALVALGKAGAPHGESHVVLEEGVGPVPVKVVLDGTSAWAQFAVAKLPEIGPAAPSRSMFAKILGLETDDVLGAPYAPQAVSCGLPFLMVGVKSLDALARARVRYDRWETTLKSSWAPDLFVFARDPETGPTHFRARCFVPSMAVPEDPATGSANASFAGFLAMRERARDGAFRWTVDQGVEMGRPSRIEIEADKSGGAITAIRVGGSAVRVMEGVLRVG